MSATLRLCPRLDDVPAPQWDALHAGTNPFVAHAFLTGLERSGCLRRDWGWTPCHALLYDDHDLVAAAPGYRKDNSHGEFVFDHAWAHAYERYGRDYYPKWLLGVPYSPVAGPRLLARDAATRAALIEAIVRRAPSLGWSSVHLNFAVEEEVTGLGPEWLSRNDVQFHWDNTGLAWRDFSDFTGAMTHKRRKAIRQERDRVRRNGYTFRIVHGDEAAPQEIDAMHDFYAMTFHEKGNSPALTVEFFRHLAQTMPRRLVLVLAEREGRLVAGAMCLRGGDTLYGRYWGGEETAPGLHFETCYYQGIDYCLREGLTRFEPGAQGEHKLARGFLPVLTHSRHLITDPVFAQALRPWCAQERASVQRYREALLDHSPFRHDDPTAASRD
jgi:predicted N-acyltransferase